SMCQDVEAAVVAAIVAVPENLVRVRQRRWRNGGRQSRNTFLQAAQQKVRSLTVHPIRNGETLLARVHEEIGDVCGEPVLVFGCVPPEAETTVGRLHRAKPRHRALQHLHTLFASEWFESEAARL